MLLELGMGDDPQVMNMPASTRTKPATTKKLVDACVGRDDVRYMVILVSRRVAPVI